MFRLGVRLTLRSGREALVRLLVTAGAVAIGVTVLLGVLAEYHAFQQTSLRPSWESTMGTPVAEVSQTAPNEALWSFSETIYDGRFVEELELAALGPQAPVPPGIPALPAAGQFYASPALSSLLATVPPAELGNRFPGTPIGSIGRAALSGPTQLVIIVGRAPAELRSLPNTLVVDHIATAPETQGTTNLYRLAFGVGAIALLFPLLILINTATRLAAARREERYAALRLVGATPRQVSVIASVDAVASALAGTVAGIALFLALRPVLARIALSGARFFSSFVTPTVWGYAGMLLGVPLAAAVAAQASLRRVRISPLGVSRKATPPRPRWWRVVPLAVGVPWFIEAVRSVSLHTEAQPPNLRPVFLSFVLVMLGLVIAGSWLTMQAARLLARVGRGPSSLLAARRLADNPKGSFRSVGGLVLAVFVGTAIAVLAPAVNAMQSPNTDTSLTNVLRVPYTPGPGLPGAPPAAAQQLIQELQAYPGVAVVPVYANPALDDQAGPQGSNLAQPADTAVPGGVIACAALRQLPVLGTCGPGTTAVQVDADVLFTDNPLNLTRNLPIATPASPSSSADPSALAVRALLVKTSDRHTLERMRTLLTTLNTLAPKGGVGSLSAYRMGVIEPETFGEVAAIRNSDVTNVERVILALLALTLLVAGCSLAVTAGGSIIERRRQFTLLRLAGAAPASLGRVVLLESLLPLLTASVIAAAAGVAVSIPLVQAVFPTLALPLPSPTYYLTMGAGVAAALGVILSTMPLVRRTTDPAGARFE